MMDNRILNNNSNNINNIICSSQWETNVVVGHHTLMHNRKLNSNSILRCVTYMHVNFLYASDTVDA